MKLRIGVLSLFTVAAVAAAAGCNDKIKAEAEEKTGGSVPSPTESENDTTDETATQAPPAAEADPQGAAPSGNDVWVGGTWGWAGGRYHWLRGRWEPRRAGFELIQARWVAEGGRWVRHPAHWLRQRR
jgi:hypothetical protein